MLGSTINVRVANKAMEDDDASTPLRGKHAHEPTTASTHRWPWVLLGVFIGLLSVLFSGVSTPIVTIKGDGAVGAGATTCGTVPLNQPFVRRNLNGKVRNVLVTGGGGFIGSHFALSLIDRKGFNVTLVDDLSRGSIETVLRLQVEASCTLICHSLCILLVDWRILLSLCVLQVGWRI